MGGGGMCLGFRVSRFRKLPFRNARFNMQGSGIEVSLNPKSLNPKP